MAKAKATIDHDEIKSWIEQRGGCPAHVRGTESNGDPGILRIDYTGFSGRESLEQISWEEFFDAFEENELAFLYQDEPKSRFSKLVSRDTVELEAGKKQRGAPRSGRRGGRRAKSTGVDAIELLERQHREVEELFEKLKGAKGSSQKERIFLKIANALAAHSKIEETLFYPAMFDEDTEEQLRDSVEEHLQVKRLIADLLEMDPSDPQFMSKVHVMEEEVLQHVEKEEEQLFELARKQTNEDLNVLGRKMEKRYRELMEGEPSEEVPNEVEHAVACF